MSKLKQAREQIEKIDREIASLFCQRMNAVKDVALYKKEHGLPVFDAQREASLIEKNASYIEDGELKEESVGSYIADYEDYIEWRFGDPVINCPIYHKITTTDTECCETKAKSLCLECRKAYNDVDWAKLQKRRKAFEECLNEMGLR